MQRATHTLRQLRAGLAGDAHALWINQQLVGRRYALGAAYVDRQARLSVLRQVGLVKPRRRAFDTHAFAGKQVADEALAQLQVRQLITGRRVEQARAETQLATGGDRGGHAQRRGNLPRHVIHPAQATEQRHHRTAVFGHGQYGGLFAFFQQQRRQGADHDTGGAQRDQRRALLIELAQGRAEFAVGLVRAVDPAQQAVDHRTRIHLRNPARRGQAALPEDDNRRAHQPCHRSPGTMISEKYGEDIGST